MNTKLDKNNKESNKFKFGDVVRTNKCFQENFHKEKRNLKDLIVKGFSFEYTRHDFNVKGDPIGYIYDLGSGIILHEDYLKR